MNTTSPTSNLLSDRRPHGTRVPGRIAVRPSEPTAQYDYEVALPGSFDVVQTHHAQGALQGSRMTDETRRTDRTSAQELFQRAIRDVDALARFATSASATFRTRTPQSFGRLSDLLDELLPDDQETEGQIARALEMEEKMLRRLRAGRLDPLGASKVGLAALWQALGLDAAAFRSLVSADHARFVGQPIRGLATRGTHETEAEAWSRLSRAYELLAQDDPSLVTEEDE